MANIQVLVLDPHTSTPLKGVVVEAHDISDGSFISTATTNDYGVASFSLTVDASFHARTVNTPPLYQTVLAQATGPGPWGFDYIVDSGWATVVAAGEGSEGQVVTTFHGLTFKVFSELFSATGALEDAIGTGANRTIWIATTHTESIAATHSLSALSANQRIVVISGGRNRPPFVVAAGLSTDPLITHNSGPSGADSLLRFEGMVFDRPGAASTGHFFGFGGGDALPHLELYDLTFIGTKWDGIIAAISGEGAVKNVIVDRIKVRDSGMQYVISTSSASTVDGMFVLRNSDFVELDMIMKKGTASSQDVGTDGIIIEGNLLRSLTEYAFQITHTRPLVFANNVVENFSAAADLIDLGTAGSTDIKDATIVGNHIRVSNASGRAVHINPASGEAYNLSIVGNTLRGPSASTAIQVDVTANDCLISNAYRDWDTNVGGAGAVGIGGDHGLLSGLSDDDHTLYSLADGTRAFTGVVGGVDPTASNHLATKEYVDSAISFISEYFFNDTASDIGGIYSKMLDVPTGEGESTFTTAGLNTGDDQALENFATDAGIPGVTTLEAGIYGGHIHVEKTVGTKPVKIHFEIYSRATDTTETLVATSEESGFITSKTDVDLHATLASDVTIAATDRIVVKWLANVDATGSNVTVVLYAEGTTNSHLEVPTSTEVLSSVFVRQDGTTPLSANWAVGGFAITGVAQAITDNAIATIDGSPNDDEYARFTAAGLEGRTEAEFKADFNLEIGTDVLAQQTIGIADDNLLEVDDADAADDDYAKFTANGLEGRSYAEVLADLGTENFPSWADTGITGAELETLSDGSDADSLHAHAAFARSEHTYVFVPDAAKGDDIAVADQQGILHHSGDQEETVTATYLDAETAPTGASLIIVIEFGDTDDLDTVGAWTTIDTVTLTATNKSVKDSTPTQATLPANRLIRMNVTQVGSTIAGADAAVHMKVKRKLTT